MFRRDGLTLELYTRSGLSPSLIWHFNLVTQVLEQYFRAKQKEQEYLELAYMKAIHETGARLTHDMKNLLQSLGSLVFAAQGSSPESGERLTLLMPLMLQRLDGARDTLFAGLLESHGHYDSETELTSATDSQIRAIDSASGPGVDALLIESLQGARVAVAVAYDGGADTPHAITLAGSRLEWRGPAARIVLGEKRP